MLDVTWFAIFVDADDMGMLLAWVVGFRAWNEFLAGAWEASCFTCGDGLSP